MTGNPSYLTEHYIRTLFLSPQVGYLDQVSVSSLPKGTIDFISVAYLDFMCRAVIGWLFCFQVTDHATTALLHYQLPQMPDVVVRSFMVRVV